MNQTEILAQTRIFAQKIHSQCDQAHDFWHVERVYKLAEKILETEQCDQFIVRMSVLLHDVADQKLTDNQRVAEDFLETLDLSTETRQQISQIIAHVGFRKNLEQVDFDCLELRVVQDADMLDGMGAIGVARAFAYGSKANRALYDPATPPLTVVDKNYASETTINHFYEKLLKLKDKLRTQTGKKLGAERHAYLADFLQEFLAEWNGEK